MRLGPKALSTISALLAIVFVAIVIVGVPYACEAGPIGPLPVPLWLANFGYGQSGR